ncbi:MAG: lysine--tRNA ligase [Planctomycetota bacterium]
MSGSEYILDRRKKLSALIEAGENPFGSRYLDVSPAALIKESYDSLEGSTVKVAGRIMAFRDHGKSVFLDLQDSSGKIQVYFRGKEIGDRFELLRYIEIGDILGAAGTLGKTRIGEVTVFAAEFTLLCKTVRPLPEKWHGLKDVETRYRRRYLDLIANRESAAVFAKRSAIIRKFRELMDARGFMEVETPMMQPIPGGASARPFITHHNTLDIDLYLRIAPELFLKRLLVGGFEKVYEIGRMFRNEGIDTRHNPEFTMAEIYEAYSDRDGMMELCESLVTTICKDVLGTFKVAWGDREIDFTPPWRRASYIDLVREATGIDPWDSEAVKSMLLEKGVKEVPAEHDFALQELFEICCEPHLLQPTFVIDHPATLTPLCRPKPDDPRLSERFELFVAGMELANAYTELNDPDLQRKFFEDQLRRGGEETIGKLDDDFLMALEYGMPPAGGMGIGIDRLVMLLTERQSIRDVVLFPLLRPKAVVAYDEFATEDGGSSDAGNQD